MSVKIRFTRFGKNNRAYFRIAVFDTHTRRDGRYLENLGTYDPVEKATDKKVKLNKERFDYWVSKGALPTESVANVLKHTGVLPKAKNDKPAVSKAGN